jgi:hypothetical protein
MAATLFLKGGRSTSSCAAGEQYIRVATSVLLPTVGERLHLLGVSSARFDKSRRSDLIDLPSVAVRKKKGAASGALWWNPVPFIYGIYGETTGVVAIARTVVLTTSSGSIAGLGLSEVTTGYHIPA